MNARALTMRVLANVPSLLVAVGETVSTKWGYWWQLLYRAQERLLARIVIPDKIALVPVLILAALVMIGVVVLGVRGDWLMVFILLGSLALTCTTPWPGQFERYLVGLAPFLTICAVLGLSLIYGTLTDSRPRGISATGRIALAGLLVVTLTAQAIVALRVYRQRQNDDARTFVEKGSHIGSPLFFHDRSWQAWEESAAWISAHASPKAIVATTAPHYFYLLTGLHAILPPADTDPEGERSLLEGVPVSYVIVDELEFLDMSRRYARPAVESDPTHWRIVHTIDDTKTYARVTNTE